MKPLFCFALAALTTMLCLPVLVGAQGATNIPLGDVTVTGSATLIRPVDMSRYALSCTNNSTSVHVRWGNATVTATTGQRIPFNTAIQILSRGAIYMISEGANVTVSCTEEGK